MNEQPGRPRSLPSPPPGDPLLAERLARLAARSAAARPAGPGPARRRHAAKGSRMAALALSLATTGGLTAVFARVDGASAGSDESTSDVGASAAAQAAVVQTSATTAATAATTVGTAGTTAVAATTGTSAAVPDTTSSVATTATVAPETSAAVAATRLADGTFVGAVDSNRWGNVQVQVTISGGVITEVDTLQYPDGDRKSVRINEQALPTIESQVLSAQGSSIDGVSGATYTTDSYLDSLQSALDQALAA